MSSRVVLSLVLPCIIKNEIIRLESKMPSIFNFQDYREFLKAFYDAEKKASGLSFALFAKKAGLNSSNYLKLVIEGTRNLTQKNLFLFSKAMKLDSEETSFFECLVHLNQSQLIEEKNFYKKRFLELQKNKSTTKNISSNIMTPSWHYPICAVIAHGKTLENAAQMLHKKYGMEKKKTLEIINYLYSHQILIENEKKQLEIAGNFFSATDKKGFSLSQELYLQDQIKISFRDFQKNYRSNKGKYISHTMTTPIEGLAILKSDMLELLSKRSFSFDSIPDGDANLLQINVQIFEIQKGML